MTVKVSPKYQVVIPEDVRRQIGIKPGMKVNVLSKGGIVYIIPNRSLEEISAKLSKKFGKIHSKAIREKKDREL